MISSDLLFRILEIHEISIQELSELLIQYDQLQKKEKNLSKLYIKMLIYILGNIYNVAGKKNNKEKIKLNEDLNLLNSHVIDNPTSNHKQIQAVFSLK